MALVERYINTASSPGGTGITSAITGTDRAYSSLDEWTASEATDLVAAGDNHTVYWNGEGGNDTSYINFSNDGWVSTKTNTLIVQRDPNDTSGNSVGPVIAYKTALYFGGNVTWSEVRNMPIKTAAGNTRAIYWASGAGIADGCICSTPSADGSNVIEASNASADGAIISNCLVLGSSQYGIRSAHWGSINVSVYNCTVIGCAQGGILDDGDQIDAKNCYVGGNGVLGISVRSMEACASDDATGSVGLQNISADNATFTAPANDDYSLASGSPLVDAGVDLSADPVYAFDIDIVGTSRVAPWDVGAYELADEGGGGGDVETPVEVAFETETALYQTSAFDVTTDAEITFVAHESLYETRAFESPTTVEVAFFANESSYETRAFGLNADTNIAFLARESLYESSPFQIGQGGEVQFATAISTWSTQTYALGVQIAFSALTDTINGLAMTVDEAVEWATRNNSWVTSSYEVGQGVSMFAVEASYQGYAFSMAEGEEVRFSSAEVAYQALDWTISDNQEIDWATISSPLTASLFVVLYGESVQFNPATIGVLLPDFAVDEHIEFRSRETLYTSSTFILDGAFSTIDGQTEYVLAVNGGIAQVYCAGEGRFYVLETQA